MELSTNNESSKQLKNKTSTSPRSLTPPSRMIRLYFDRVVTYQIEAKGVGEMTVGF